MRPLKATALVGLFLIVTSVAQSQPAAGPYGHGPGPMAGAGWGHGDPAAYLDSLKADLAITEQQGSAWNRYADTVKGVAEQMQGVHQSMYEAMGTASWQERRDMMNRMFQSRQQAFDTVHAAAEDLLPALDPAQRAKAQTRLPGLAAAGHGMMGHMGMGPRAP
jgi:LTXXQ motif family protein